MQRLANSEPEIGVLSLEVIDEVLLRVGWPIPYYLQLMFHSLVSIAAERRSSNFPTVDDVATAFLLLLLHKQFPTN